MGVVVIYHMTAQELREWRKSVGLTRAALADKIGVSVRTIESWEQDGRNSIIPKQSLLLISELTRLDTLNIPLSSELKAKLARLEKEHGIDDKQWAAELLAKALLLLIATLALFHVTRSPRNWIVGALKQTVVAAVSWSSAQMNSIHQK